MVSINYPSYPGGVDVGGIMGATHQGYQAGKAWRDNKNDIAGFGRYLEGSLSDLGKQFAATQNGGVQRAPIGGDPATARVDQAFAAPGQANANTLSGNQIAGRFLKTVRDGGLTNPFGLAAVAATGKNESGFDPKRAVSTWSDPSQSGQAGTSGGILSWRNERLAKLQAFAQANGDDPNAPSPETQGKYLLTEDPSLIARLQSAQSPQEAQDLMNRAWKFAGYDQPGGEAGQRVADAQAYAPQFSGGDAPAPSQQALEQLSVGQSAPMGQGAPQQAQQGGFQPQQASSILPPRDVMLELFKSPGTRPLAIELVKAAQGLRADANNPEKQLELQIAQEKLRMLRDPQSKLINAGGGAIYDPNKGEWISAPDGVGKSGETGLTPVLLHDKDGNMIYGQATKDGKIVRSTVPDGFAPVSPYEKASQTSQGKIDGEAAANPTRVQAQSSLNSTLSSLDRLGTAASDVAADPALSRITGITGMIPNMPGGNAAGVQARLNTLKTQIGFTVLQAMRDASKTGGALGAISDRENEMLQNALASLDQAQSEDDLKRELGKISDYVNGAKQRLQAGYDQTYGNQGNGAQQSGAADLKKKYGLD